MKRKMEQFIFNAFGFPVLLHDVPIGETESGKDYLNLSLRELSQEMDLPDTSLKLWEDSIDKITGLELNQEKRLKYLTLMHIQTKEQKEFLKRIFESKVWGLATYP